MGGWFIRSLKQGIAGGALPAFRGAGQGTQMAYPCTYGRLPVPPWPLRFPLKIKGALHSGLTKFPLDA
ncbi:hypothetical protein AYO49_05245 [Verrucomicrobiaceae bacterium SCGC AG-212-N21]|nr:hypothetical protein AYO49_05245 [Verrucomicrobiaceae bacterium SCGC AG-212-N21]